MDFLKSKNGSKSNMFQTPGMNLTQNPIRYGTKYDKDGLQVAIMLTNHAWQSEAMSLSKCEAELSRGEQ